MLPREYRNAEARLKASIEQRRYDPGHTYPGREEDLATMTDYHRHHGIPPAGAVAGLWWSLKKRWAS